MYFNLISFRNGTLRQKSVLRVSASIALFPTWYELLFNYLPEIIVHILLTCNCLDSSSLGKSAGVVLIPLVIPLMYQNQGSASLCCRTGKRNTDFCHSSRKLIGFLIIKSVCSLEVLLVAEKRSEITLVFDLVCGGEAVEGFGTLLIWKGYPELGHKCDHESIMFKPCTSFRFLRKD